VAGVDWNLAGDRGLPRLKLLSII